MLSSVICGALAASLYLSDRVLAIYTKLGCLRLYTKLECLRYIYQIRVFAIIYQIRGFAIIYQIRGFAIKCTQSMLGWETYRYYETVELPKPKANPTQEKLLGVKK